MIKKSFQFISFNRAMRLSLLALFVFCVFFNSEAEKRFWNKGRGYDPWDNATAEGIMIENLTDTLQYSFYKLPNPTEKISISFREKNFNSHPSKKYSYYRKDGKEESVSNPAWGIFLTTSSDTVIISVRQQEIKRIADDETGLKITVQNFGDKSKSEEVITGNVNPFSGDNLWTIKIEEANLLVSLGEIGKIDRIVRPVSGDILGFGFFTEWGGKILVSDIEIDYSTEAAKNNIPETDDLDGYFSLSKDFLEGYWAIFDRELEESMLQLGGDYLFACIKEGIEYLFVYLEGAQVNATQWHRGDIKLKLSPSRFPGIYDVTWYDSMKLPMGKEIKAERGEGETLLIQFPYQQSKIRLRKIKSI